MREIVQSEYIKLFTTPEGYHYAERKGRDSIAFVIYNVNTEKYTLRLEYKPPIGTHILGAFGGSLDKELTLHDIVQQEVAEEAGYEVPLSDIDYIGKYFVSTQMNQFCHLFMVRVDRLTPRVELSLDAQESTSSNLELDKYDPRMYNLECWKATILINWHRKNILNG